MYKIEVEVEKSLWKEGSLPPIVRQDNPNGIRFFHWWSMLGLLQMRRFLIVKSKYVMSSKNHPYCIGANRIIVENVVPDSV